MHECVTHSANIELAPAVLQVVLACYSHEQWDGGVLVWEWGWLSGLILPLVSLGSEAVLVWALGLSSVGHGLMCLGALDYQAQSYIGVQVM